MSLRLLFFALLLFGISAQLLSACQVQRDVVPPDVQKGLIGSTWLNSYEEEPSQGTTRIFRPDTYVFPPSFGRSGYRFDAQGKLTYYSIAPADGMESHPGTWKSLGNNAFRITLTDGFEAAYTVQVVSLADDVLRLQRLP